jgi:hypothetical protein
MVAPARHRKVSVMVLLPESLTARPPIRTMRCRVNGRDIGRVPVGHAVRAAQTWGAAVRVRIVQMIGLPGSAA